MLERWSIFERVPHRGCYADHRPAIKVFSKCSDALPRENKRDGVLKSTLRALNGRLAKLALECQAMDGRNTLMAGGRTERN